MNTYSTFYQSRIKHLWSVSDGWLGRSYQVTDGTYSYGKLSYSGFLDPIVQIDTAAATWFIRKRGLSFMDVMNAEGRLIGTIERKWFTNKTIFTGADGFIAFYHKVSFWRSAYVWVKPDYQVLLSCESSVFNRTESFNYSDLAYEQPYLLLLTFLALELNLRRRRGAAA